MAPFVPFRKTLFVRFLWKDSVLAWQCSACGKLFTISIEEAEQVPTFIPPQEILDAYTNHRCWMKD